MKLWSVWYVAKTLINGPNEYISIQDGIIVIIVLILYDLLNLLLSEDNWKEREFGTEKYERVTGMDEKCCIVL